MITIICSGSRGDYQPYIALAKELKQSGKEVRITAGKDYEKFIQSYGIDVYPINADMQSLNADSEFLKAAGSADNPLKMLLAFNKLKEYVNYMTEDFYAACKESELIIYHPGCAIGYFAAKKIGIPSILASPFPMHHTKEFLSVIIYGRTKSNLLTTKLSYLIFHSMLWMISKKSVKTFFKKQSERLPKDFGAPFEQHNSIHNPAIVSCSNYVFKRPTDWNKHIHQYGYWYVKEDTEYVPSDELARFLNSGEIPIYIGFGSMTTLEKHQGLADLAVEALVKSGKRGIVCGMGTPSSLPENVFVLNSVPHSWLFERVAAVCHHGGAGTTAAGFKAGVPSIIIPFSNDQFAWAYRAYDLGVGVKPIPKNELTSDRLAAAINDAFHDNIITEAKVLGENIATETGAKMCAEVIINTLKKQPVQKADI